MAVITFGEMQDRVGELINQDVSTDNKTVTNTEIKANLNIGYSKCVNAIVGVSEGYFMRRAYADLVNGQESYSLPLDCRKLVRLNIAFTGGTYYKADKLDMTSTPNPTSGLYTTSMPTYSITGNEFIINPTSGSDVTDGLELWYIEDQSDMVNDADEPNLPLGFHHVPVIYAVAKAKQKLGLEQEAQAYLKEFENEVSTMASQIQARSGNDRNFVRMSDFPVEI